MLRSWQPARRVGCLLAVAALMAGCDGAQQQRNLLLISLDTLRADHLGCYGYSRPTSPFLDRLAARGMLFENAFTTAPWTLPSHTSLFTGLYPSQHGVINDDVALPSEVPTLAELLKKQGFATAGFVSGVYLRPRFGLDRGFDHYVVVPTRAQGGDSGTGLSATDRVSAAGLGWLGSQPKRPFFLFLHYFDIHSDYRPEPRYAELFTRAYQGTADGSSRQLRAFLRGQVGFDATDRAHLVDLYDAEIRQLDRALEDLFERLTTSGELANTIVVVTSDHGEEFFERGGVMHGRTQYQEMLHIPLLIAGPGIPSGRSDRPVSLVDLLPTLLALTGAPVSTPVSGLDLAPLWNAPADPWPERALFAEANRTFGGNGSRRAIARGRWKLVVHGSGQRELFDLAEDRGERVDRAGSRPELTAELADQLATELGNVREARALPPLEPDLRKQLEALGYVRE